MTESLITIKSLCASYSNGVSSLLVLKDVSFSQRAGEFVSILGPNGSGKTTLIKIIAGLRDYDGGSVSIGGAPPSSSSMRRAVVFQDFALFDWMSAVENVEFGLKARGVSRPNRRKIAIRFVNAVGLGGHESKYPHELSGGLKQRVAIARALATEPDFLLMDEPFASLDSQVRRRLHELVLDISERESHTILFVTHDPEEAIFLSDRVILLSERPSTVRLDLPILLSHPRTADMRYDPAFRAYIEAVTSAGFHD